MEPGTPNKCGRRPPSSASERKGELARFFDGQAVGYDGPVLRFLGNREFAALTRLLPGPCDALDYGCGAGRFSFALASLGYRITGYDLSPNMAARAAGRAARMGIDATFTADPGAVQGTTWPLVVCMGVMDYYRDPEMLFEQVAPCVAPGGRLIVGAPNVFGPLSWAHTLLFLFSVRMYMFRASTLAKAGLPYGLTATRTLYALPAVPLLGMSVLVEYEKKG